MQQQIIINAITDEIRVALLENGQLTELDLEQQERKHITGNIYKGRVTRVLPGMQAAFVDVGLAKDAFLYVLDFYDNIEKFEKGEDDLFEDEVDEINQAEAEQLANGENGGKEQQPPKENNRENNRSKSKERDRERALAIENKLKAKQEIIVQIAKEPIGTKGARVTSHISLPGRYLVYMPTVEHVGVSHRITSSFERGRLRDIIKRIKPPDCGFIVRTVGEGKSEEHFKRDMEFLISLWNRIREKSEKVIAPTMLYQDLDVIFRRIRDIFTDDVDRVVIDSEEYFTRCIEFTDSLMPHLTNRIKLYLKPRPIFDYYNIEQQVELALRKKVWLKSGGYIVIDEAEALVAIDVNTGKYVGKKNLEETIFKINLEAIQEIVRQVRLRDLGGIIIIDFIDMKEEKHRQQLMQTLEESLKKDRTRTNVLQLTDLGLVEMTRKRAKKSLGKITSQPCPCCKGTGRIKTPMYTYHAIQRDLIRLYNTTGARQKKEDIILRVHPEVAQLFMAGRKKQLRRLENICHKRINIKTDGGLLPEQYEIVDN